MTRKITDLEKITNLNQMKVGEYYTVGNGRGIVTSLVKCIYVDLFGQPIILSEDSKNCVPVVLSKGKTVEDYYLKHRGITHVKVEEPRTGFCWLVTYTYEQQTWGSKEIYSVVTRDPENFKKREVTNGPLILSIKKVQWTEGENDFDASL